MTTITITTEEGTKEVDAELLRAYYGETAEYLKAEAEAKTLIKESVEMQAEALGIKPAELKKYFKARFKAETKKLKQQGELYAQLDAAFDAPAQTA